MQREWQIHCDLCGRFIAYQDIENGSAVHDMITPASDVSYETWKTMCKRCVREQA